LLGMAGRATAAAILTGGLPPPSMGAAVPATGNRPSPERQAAAVARPAIPSNAPLSKEERFIKDLYEQCRMVNPRLAMWLNNSCEVLSLGEEELELGFQRPMPMEKVDKDCRTLVEQQAEVLLGRPIRMKVRLVEGAEAAPKRETKRGHLAEAARQMGATPVGKE